MDKTVTPVQTSAAHCEAEGKLTTARTALKCSIFVIVLLMNSIVTAIFLLSEFRISYMTIVVIYNSIIILMCFKIKEEPHTTVARQLTVVANVLLVSILAIGTLILAVLPYSIVVLILSGTNNVEIEYEVEPMY